MPFDYWITEKCKHTWFDEPATQEIYSVDIHIEGLNEKQILEVRKYVEKLCR